MALGTCLTLCSYCPVELTYQRYFIKDIALLLTFLRVAYIGFGLGVCRAALRAIPEAQRHVPKWKNGKRIPVDAYGTLVGLFIGFPLLTCILTFCDWKIAYILISSPALGLTATSFLLIATRVKTKAPKQDKPLPKATSKATSEEPTGVHSTPTDEDHHHPVLNEKRKTGSNVKSFRWLSDVAYPVMYVFFMFFNGCFASVVYILLPMALLDKGASASSVSAEIMHSFVGVVAGCIVPFRTRLARGLLCFVACMTICILREVNTNSDQTVLYSYV